MADAVLAGRRPEKRQGGSPSSETDGAREPLVLHSAVCRSEVQRSPNQRNTSHLQVKTCTPLFIRSARVVLRTALSPSRALCACDDPPQQRTLRARTANDVPDGEIVPGSMTTSRHCSQRKSRPKKRLARGAAGSLPLVSWNQRASRRARHVLRQM
jgi:hypothetical protein